MKKTLKPKAEFELTNLNKIYFPKLKLTKGNVIDYYSKIAKIMLPYLKDRPESLNRHPEGIRKPSFYQKNFSYKTPSFVQLYKRRSESTQEDINYLVCQNLETLLYMANLGCIEINPWSSRTKSPDRPDWMVIDLDPGNNTLEELITVAKEVKSVLDMACEHSFVKTSGKTGLHIFIPLGARYGFEEIRKFSELLVNIVHDRLPEITSIERKPIKRKNKIYLDFLQNSLGQTLAAPYSLRPTEEATVSTPLKWSEVKNGLDPKKFTIFSIFERLKKTGDLWRDIFKKRVDLNKSIKCLEKEFAKINKNANK